MSEDVTVRRVRLHEWEAVRDLRIAAVRDPDAAIAFLSTAEQELARDESLWRERTAGAALGENAAQFIAEVDGEWVGTATVLIREPELLDHLGRVVDARRADVVGVYVRPTRRGAGIVGLLFDAAAGWTLSRGVTTLTLDVHRDNARAQAAYRKAGFAPTGITFTSVIGPEIEMARTLNR